MTLGGGDSSRQLQLTTILAVSTTQIYLQVLLVRTPEKVSLGETQGESRMHSCLEALEQNPSPGLPQLLQAARIPWLVAPSSIFNDSNTASLCLISSILNVSLQLSSSVPLPLLNSCDCIGPIQIIQANSLC